MAANYWDSTQFRFWLFTRAELIGMRQVVSEHDATLVQQYPLPESRYLSMFFQQQLLKLHRRLSIRQQALATAQIYIRRLYLRVGIRRTNPYLIVATALYLACKMEECPQHIRTIVSEARNLWPDFVSADVSKIGECEFFLISEMSSQLIVHHPYRTLANIQKELEMAPDEVSLAWSVVNDHYLTDIPLLYNLHVIAATAAFLALALKPAGTGIQSSSPTLSFLGSQVQAALDGGLAEASGEVKSHSKVQQLIKWLAESEVDIKAMIECTQEMISLYEALEQYSEKGCKDQVSRLIKGRNLDR